MSDVARAALMSCKTCNEERGLATPTPILPFAPINNLPVLFVATATVFVSLRYTPLLGTVLLVHGLGEHAGRYQEVAAHLRSWGFIVRAYDQQGHGQSAGARGDMLRPGSLQADLGHVIDATRQRPHCADRPLVLLGHSMGGLVVARALAEQLRYVDGAVLSSPALGATPNALQKLLLATLPKLLPHLCVDNGLNADLVARDAQVVQAYKADPLVHDRVSGRLSHFLLASGTLARQRAVRWPVPTGPQW